MEERKMNWPARLAADGVLVAAGLALLAWGAFRGQGLRPVVLGGVAAAFALGYLLYDVLRWRREKKAEEN